MVSVIIPFHGKIVQLYHIWFIHSSADRHSSCFHLLAVVNSAAMNICVQICVWISGFNFIGYIPKCRIAGSYGISMFNFLRNYFQLLLHYFTFHTSSVGVRFLHILPNTCHFLFVFIIGILIAVKWYLIVVLMRIFLMTSEVTKSRTRLSAFPFTFHFQVWEKEMATHSSILAWRIPGTGEPGGLPSMGSHRVGHDWRDLAAAVRSFQVVLVVKNLPPNAGDIRDAGSIPRLERSPGRGHGNPLQYSCLANSMDRRAWRATVHRVRHDWSDLACMQCLMTVRIFHVLIGHVYVFSGEMSLEKNVFCKWIFVVNCKSSLYIMDTKCLSNVWLARTSSDPLGCLLTLLIMSFDAPKFLFLFSGHTAQLAGSWFPHQRLNPGPWQWKPRVLTTGPPVSSQKFYILMQSNFSNMSFIAYGFSVISQRPLSNLRSQWFTPMFSSK